MNFEISEVDEYFPEVEDFEEEQTETEPADDTVLRKLDWTRIVVNILTIQFWNVYMKYFNS